MALMVTAINMCINNILFKPFEVKENDLYSFPPHIGKANLDHLMQNNGQNSIPKGLRDSH